MWTRLESGQGWRQCASAGCTNHATHRLEVDGVGSNYCAVCQRRIVDLRTHEARANSQPPT